MTDKRDEAARDGEPFWVFAYGSLIWNPGFDPAERRPAILRDFRRSFCMRSIHHRGSEAHPGLVLALDFAEGASCAGLALRVRHHETREVMEALRERELISSAYLEKWVELETEAGPVTAVAFVIDRDHAQYAGGLPPEAQADIIAAASGGRGTNADYLFQTVEALDGLSIADGELAELATLVRRRREN